MPKSKKNSLKSGIASSDSEECKRTDPSPGLRNPWHLDRRRTAGRADVEEANSSVRSD